MAQNPTPTAEEWEALPGRWRQSREESRRMLKREGVDFEDFFGEFYTRLLCLEPLVEAMRRHPELRALYPFTSHATLRLRRTPPDTVPPVVSEACADAGAEGHFRALRRRARSNAGRQDDEGRDDETLREGTADEIAAFLAEFVARESAGVPEDAGRPTDQKGRRSR